MQPEIIALIVLVAIVLASVVIVLAARRRSERLRERFGPEYDRAVADGRGRGEAELAARERRVAELEIHPLDPERRDEYARGWRDAQAQFVDSPGEAVQEADRLVAEVMRERGYPVGDFDQREADLSVHHGEELEHFRAAHGITLAYRQGHAGTEDLRQAMVHYRALFERLLDTAPADEPDVVIDIREPERKASAGGPER
jgi:predicted nucleic acid-binding protein